MFPRSLRDRCLKRKDPLAAASEIRSGVFHQAGTAVAALFPFLGNASRGLSSDWV